MTKTIARPSSAPVTQPSADFQNKILTLLSPLFLSATGGDVGAAREAVRATLVDYRARTDAELRFAALVVAFGFGALEALSRAAGPELPLETVIDLRENAITLSQAGDKAQTALDKLLKRQPQRAVATRSAILPASIEVDDLLAFARKQSAVGGTNVEGEQQRDFRTLPVAPGGGRVTLH